MQLTSMIAEQMPGFVGWKDLNLVYLGCNTNLATKLKLGHPSNIIGLTDRDLIDYNEETYAFHHRNDLLALSGKTVHCLHKSTSPYDGEEYVFLKQPLLNDDNQIIGLIFHCTPQLSSINPIQLIDHVDRLTKREMECLSYILQGRTLKETADILQLSKRTVETYFENIKNKLGCKNKTELLLQVSSRGILKR